MNRRVLLGAIGTLSVTLTGCLSESGGESGDNSSLEQSNTDNDSSDSGEFADDFNPGFEPKSKLGEGDLASIEAEPEREYEYIEEEDTVYIEYDRAGSTEMSFDEWGTRRAADAGSGHVRGVIENEGLDSEILVETGVVELADISDDVDESMFIREIELGVIVNHETSYTADGTKLSEPAVDFEEVVEIVPRSVEVTMAFEERHYTAVLPVLCRRNWIQED
ncbi:hypothetical protein [Natrarchaeobaculum sulfurireducens]|uniref:hypothetical protein n=1 Tax=Natrarchaeobaculum sulfurireducens TaxID=2044521 RepID=UPI000E3DE872|nr:hypothetical protein [Natrarchaeobaculum sulfurireducens]